MCICLKRWLKQRQLHTPELQEQIVLTARPRSHHEPALFLKLACACIMLAHHVHIPECPPRPPSNALCVPVLEPLLVWVHCKKSATPDAALTLSETLGCGHQLEERRTEDSCLMTLCDLNLTHSWKFAADQPIVEKRLLVGSYFISLIIWCGTLCTVSQELRKAFEAEYKADIIKVSDIDAVGCREHKLWKGAFIPLRLGRNPWNPCNSHKHAPLRASAQERNLGKTLQPNLIKKIQRNVF